MDSCLDVVMFLCFVAIVIWAGYTGGVWGVLTVILLLVVIFGFLMEKA